MQNVELKGSVSSTRNAQPYFVWRPTHATHSQVRTTHI